jgi:hypothetical protein
MCPGTGKMSSSLREEYEQQDERECLASMVVHYINIMVHYIDKEGIKNGNWRKKKYNLEAGLKQFGDPGW